MGKIKKAILRFWDACRAFKHVLFQGGMEDMGLSGNVRDLQIRVHDIQDRVYDDIFKNKTYQAQMLMLMWYSIKRENESLLEAKQRFFLDMEPAKGTLRLTQMAALDILKKIDHICRENTISYWISYGTLLGAVRHKGFVPWDDDMDICMMREDLERLIDYIDTYGQEYGIRIFNHYTIGPKNTCKLYRVMFQEEKIPLFVDIFVYDYAEKVGADAQKSYWKIRKQYVKDTAQYRNTPNCAAFRAYKDDRRWKITEAKTLDAIQNRERSAYEKLSKKVGLSKTNNPSTIKGVMWGIDNLTILRGPISVSIDDIFPLQEVSFEGCSFYAPQNISLHLQERYGDIYSLPEDMLSHQHISLTEAEVQMLRKLLPESP